MLKLANLFKNKKILIYGFGKSGKASFKYLRKNNNLKIFDDNNLAIKKNYKKFFLKKKFLRSIDFDFIVISPGIDINKCPLKKYLLYKKDKIINELDIFYLNNIKNIKITITGTNGKSTTSQLLYEIIKTHNKDVRLVGNIGKPLLLERNINPDTIFVIEASSYQIEYSKFFKTKYSMILNISRDHIERHGSFQNYIKAKLKLIENQETNGYALIDKNLYLNKELKKIKLNTKIKKINTNLSQYFRKKIKNPYFENMNNLKNLKFITEISKKLKLREKRILNIVNSFKGLKFRQQIIYRNKKIQIINDSKSTSFSSSINLLKSYKNIFWLVGGQFKKGDIFKLEKKYYKNIKAYIFGKNKKNFIKNLKNKVIFKNYNNIEEALQNIIKDIGKNNLYPKTIIFSPSGSSFDQFNNFEERGYYFNHLIKKIQFVKKINERK
tara:strand:+ start:159 stop:1475 length:1317 start_codon:yes stop_codon:yes gene_type:complete